MRTLMAVIVAAGMTLAAPAPASAETGTAPKTGYAKVNGLNLYYEIHGSGEPMVLLHGGLGASGMFGEILPLLSKTRQVITVDRLAGAAVQDRRAPQEGL
ncbi:MAG TPA: hypothetical protein VK595_11010 [Vicinamibacterales bacterium]|nr:hypothetical protein [Vicinamibacterales bacterium]